MASSQRLFERDVLIGIRTLPRESATRPCAALRRVSIPLLLWTTRTRSRTIVQSFILDVQSGRGRDPDEAAVAGIRNRLS